MILTLLFSEGGIQNQRPRIYILPKSKPKLINICKPYFLPSMLYKLNLNFYY